MHRIFFGQKHITQAWCSGEYLRFPLLLESTGLPSHPKITSGDVRDVVSGQCCWAVGTGAERVLWIREEMRLAG